MCALANRCQRLTHKYYDRVLCTYFAMFVKAAQKGLMSFYFFSIVLNTVDCQLPSKQTLKVERNNLVHMHMQQGTYICTCICVFFWLENCRTSLTWLI
jgi:hypothetical protein